MKALLRDIVASTARAVGISSPAVRHAGRLVILTFHRVLPESLRSQYPLPGLVVTPEELRWVVRHFQAVGELCTLSDGIRRVEDDARRDAVVSVTFDDGQWDNYRYAAAVMDDLGVQGTFYVPTRAISLGEPLWHDRVAFAWGARHCGVLRSLPAWDSLADSPSALEFIERIKRLLPAQRDEVVDVLGAQAATQIPEWARMMNWTEVRSLAEAGHEIGSHSVSHALMTHLSEKQQANELLTSKAEIESHIRSAVTSFCYPNGDHDEALANRAREAGYENAVTTMWGTNCGSADRYRLRRCDVNVDHLTDRKGRLSAARLDLRIAGLALGLPK
jgi:peptidoglycan/xylan/chitin deacetylase (PgdA/CDA1 family)